MQPILPCQSCKVTPQVGRRATPFFTRHCYKLPTNDPSFCTPVSSATPLDLASWTVTVQHYSHSPVLCVRFFSTLDLIKNPRNNTRTEFITIKLTSPELFWRKARGGVSLILTLYPKILSSLKSGWQGDGRRG